MDPTRNTLNKPRRRFRNDLPNLSISHPIYSTRPAQARLAQRVNSFNPLT